MAQAQPLYVLEAVDVRRADETDQSRRLTITKIALPEVKRKTTNFAPGGGIGELAIAMPQIDPIMPKFELKGYDTDIISRMGFATGQHDKWLFAGALRDKQTGKAIPARAVIQGIVSTWTPDESELGGLAGCNYEINEVTHYEFSIDGTELFYFDWMEGVGRSGGVDWFQDVRTALGV
ncbi:MAG: phage major tail tube protein [Bauldia sp.]